MVPPRFEILPLGRGEEEAARLPEPAALTVTCSPRHGPDQAIEVGARLRRLGHTITVHIAARMVRDAGHAEALLLALAAAGIEDAFVIGGDTKDPVGAFSSAGELLEVFAGHPERPRALGIAAYPEGHPLIDDVALHEALARKSALADYVVTQMCFDAGVMLDWLRGARREGLRLPVMVGLPGEADRRRLLEVSMKIGVGPSLNFLRKQRGLRQLLSRASSAEKLFDALVPALEDAELGITGFHYFTFNQLVDTWAFDRQKRESWKLVVGS